MNNTSILGSFSNFSYIVFYIVGLSIEDLSFKICELFSDLFTDYYKI